MMIKRPILRYYGGKFQASSKILGYFPKHQVYVEPFGGAANILLRKDRCDLEVYNDLNSRVVNFFKVLRDRPAELLMKLHLTPYAREELDYCCTLETDDPLESARCLFVESWMTIQGAGIESNSKVNFRGSRDRGGFFPPELSDLYACAERLKKVVIEHTDAFKVIDKYDGENTILYIDPPYNGRPGEDYAVKFTEHERLAEVLHAASSYVIVSALDNELYRKLYWDWLFVDILINGTANRTKREVLIMNYAL